MIAAVAREGGADVVLVEPNGGRRELAESIGLATLDPRERPVAERVDEWTEGAGAGVSFEVSGTAPGIESALHALGPRGRLVVVGIHATPPPVDLFRVFWRELTIVGARVYERPDFEEAVRLLARGRIPVDTLVTDVLPLARTADAFSALENGRAMKILIDCSGERRVSFDLTGTRALVTGCRRGIGLAIAEALAAAGADIVGASVNLELEGSEVQGRVEAHGREFAAYRADLGSQTGAAELAARVLGDGHRIDILVNNAGTIARAPALEHDDETWRRVLQTNLTSGFVLARELAKPMVERGRGKIVFTASLLSFQGGINVVSYTAAKSGVAGLVRALANEWAPLGVNVNAIAPGYVVTDNTRGAARRPGPVAGDRRPDPRRPLGRA